MASGTVKIVHEPLHAVKNLKKPTIKTSADVTALTTSWEYVSGSFDKANPSRFQGVLVRWQTTVGDQFSLDNSYDTSTYTTKINTSKPVSKSYKDSNGNTIYYYARQDVTLNSRYLVRGTGYGTIATRALGGSDAKSHTYRLKRKEYYPFVDDRTKQKQVRTYTARSITWNGSTPTIIWTHSGARDIRGLSGEVSSGYVGTMAELKAQLIAHYKAYGQRLGVDDSFMTGIYVIYGRIGNIDVVKSVNVTPGEVTYIPERRMMPYLLDVGVEVQGWNAYSNPANVSKSVSVNNVRWTEGWYAPTAAQILKFAKPLAPSITKMEIGKSSGSSQLSNRINVAVEARCNRTSANERARTMIEVYASSTQYNFSSKIYETNYEKKVTYEALNKASKYKYNEKFEFTINPDDFLIDQQGRKRTIASMEMNEYLTFRVTAVNQGFRGDSEITSKEFTIAYPHTTTIKRITSQGQHYHIDFVVSGHNGTTRKRKTKSFTLQRLRNYMPDEEDVDDWSDAKWLAYLKDDMQANWSDVATLPPSTRSFSDNIYDAKPAGYTRTFYRIRANTDIESLSHVYSQPFALPFFNRIPSARNELTNILAIHSTEDGNGLQVVANFTKTKNSQGVFNSNGTELSWDQSSYAWKSNNQPASYDYYDNKHGFSLVTSALKNSNKVLGATTYKKLLANANVGTYITTYYIGGLQSLTEYYVKARRFMKDTNVRKTESYGKYASYEKDGQIATIAPSKRPTDVKVSVPDEVVYGKDFSISWEYESDAKQVMYSVMWHRGDNEAAIEAAETLLSKEDKVNYCVIPWNSIQDKFFNDTLYLSVKVKTVHYWSKIEEIEKVKLIRPPKAALGSIAPVAQQPFKITLYTNKPTVSAIVRIYSHGVSTWGPEGGYTQPEGTVVYSNKFYPNWSKVSVDSIDSVGKDVQYEAVDPIYSYNLQLEDLHFMNEADYTVEYHVVDEDSGLTSIVMDSDGEEKRASADFSVKYAKRAVRPSGYVTLSSQTLTNTGHDAAARISVYLDPSYVGEEREYLLDKCSLSIYRVTPDGVTGILSNASPWAGRTYVDSYPAFSKDRNCMYRIALTTENGETEWTDLEYRCNGYSVRFDWGSSEAEEHGQYTHLVLPYNLTWTDQWTKSSKVEEHMDGSITGHWRPGTSRSNSLSTKLARIEGVEQCDRVRALAKYAGPVLVRLPDGCCFTADVTVSSLENAFDQEVLSVSFSAKEIQNVDAFDIVSSDSLLGLMAPQTYEKRENSWYKSLIDE